ncbi:MAG: hypothetical protein HY606_09935 [Planctomycetes bacterium]|nr:hypothetical protein [Planctomycetota bacterium]
MGLFEKVLKTKEDDEWTKDVLLNKAKINTTVTGNWQDPKGKWMKENLLSPTLERQFFSLDIFPDIEEIAKGEITSASTYDASIDNFLKKCLLKGVPSFTCGIPVDFRFEDVKRDEINILLMKKRPKNGFGEDEKNRLMLYALIRIMEVLNDKGFSWVIATGTRHPVKNTYSIPGFNPMLFFNLCNMFHRYPKVKFFIMLASQTLSQELCIISKEFPNVYPCGFWWHDKYWTYLERMIAERLDTLPMNRTIGFFSDAYTTEWSYGKLCMIKHAMSKVLVQRVEEGLYDEDLAIEIARRWLYDNPKEAYFGSK